MQHIEITSESESIPRTCTQDKLAWKDIAQGLKKWPVWLMLAYHDIRLRYRRSVLGPFWITLSMAVTVYSMGFLYAHLFRTNLTEYYPFLVSGMVTWALIASSMTDLTDTFVVSEGLIKQIKLPYSLYIHRVVSRNILIFFHNLAVMIPIFFFFSATAKISWASLFVGVGLLIFYINFATFGMIIAIIGARYRDISQIVKSLVQVIFFITPVMWNPKILPPDKQFLVLLNPFYSFIDIIRSPLLGNLPSITTLIISLSFTLLGLILSWKMFSRYRSRIIYWL